jgi:phosphoribosyl 1,2-cyclic phosphate phosphodiesterase
VRLYFLGTGTSFGIPVIGCRCHACTSRDPRDRRGRHGALLESDDRSSRLLIDTPPELRLQLLEAGVADVDAVWFTHGHADHTHGVDDLRAFSARGRRPVVAYAGEDTAALLRSRFGYIFDAAYQPPVGTSKPELRLDELRPHEPVDVGPFHVLPLPLPHGDMTSWGFRVGDLGYITDAKRIPAESLALLSGIRTLVLSALWFGRPHPTHFNVEEALEASAAIGAEWTYLTHLTHRHTHEELLARLPAHVLPAYDGLVIEV